MCMTWRRQTAFVVILFATVSAMPIAAGPKAKVVIDAAREQLQGDKIRGPVTLELRNVNTLRDSVQVGQTATFVAGPNLNLSFIPQISQTPPGGAPPPAAGTPLAPAQQGQPPLNRVLTPPTITDTFRDYLTRLGAIETAFAALQRNIAGIIDNANDAVARVQALLDASDGILKSSDRSANGIQTGILNVLPDLLTRIDNTVQVRWPNGEIGRMAGELANLRNDLVTMTAFSDWGTWSAVSGNKQAYDATLNRVMDLQKLVTSLDASNQSAVALDAAQKKLLGWRAVLIGVQAAGLQGFVYEVEIPCGFTFFNEKTVKLEMISLNRNAPAGTNPTRQELISVVCSQPLSVSAGFGFSTVHERDIAFVQSQPDATGKSASIFGYKGNSNFHPLPLALVNARVYEWNDKWSLHFSNGAAVDVKTGAAGTDIEYVSGLSLALSRVFFLTGGVHVGRESKLAGGFKVGDPVPVGLAQPPLEKKWTPGFVFAASFRVR